MLTKADTDTEGSTKSSLMTVQDALETESVDL